MNLIKNVFPVRDWNWLRNKSDALVCALKLGNKRFMSFVQCKIVLNRSVLVRSGFETFTLIRSVPFCEFFSLSSQYIPMNPMLSFWCRWDKWRDRKWPMFLAKQTPPMCRLPILKTHSLVCTVQDPGRSGNIIFFNVIKKTFNDSTIILELAVIQRFNIVGSNRFLWEDIH